MKKRTLYWSLIALLMLMVSLSTQPIKVLSQTEKKLQNPSSQNSSSLSGSISYVYQETYLTRASEVSLVLKSSSGKVFNLIASKKGEFSFTNLSPGIYELELKGWCSRKTIVVGSGENKIDISLSYYVFADKTDSYPDLEQCPDDEKAFGQALLNFSQSETANEAFAIKKLNILDKVYAKSYQNEGIYVKTVASALQEVGAYCQNGRLYHKDGKEIVFVNGPTQHGGFPPNKDVKEERRKYEKTRSEAQTDLQSKYYVIQISDGIEGILPPSTGGGRSRR